MVEKKSKALKIDKKDRNFQSMLKNSMQIVEPAKLKPIVDYNDSEYIHDQIVEYLQKCEEFNAMPTITMFCAFLRIDKATFYKWVERNKEHPTTRMFKSLQTALAGLLEQGSLNGSLNNITAIFLLKSTHGYQEANTVTIEHKNSTENTLTTKEIEQRINDEIIDVDYNVK